MTCLSTFTIHNQPYTTHRLRRLSTVSPPYRHRNHNRGGDTLRKPRSSPYTCNLSSDDRPWAHWIKLKQPKLIVAPMYDGSELPFRMLCRKYGAEAAYTPMLHSRTFAESKKFRSREFSTCEVRNCSQLHIVVVNC